MAQCVHEWLHPVNQVDAGPAGTNTMASGHETLGRLFAIGYLKGLLEGQGIEFDRGSASAPQEACNRTKTQALTHEP